MHPQKQQTLTIWTEHEQQNFVGTVIQSKLLLPNWLQAEPIKGFGLYLSVGDLQISDSSTEQNYAESYAYGGIVDYQWAASDYFSVRLFGGEHIGSAQQPDKPDYNYFKTGLIGLEARVWAGSSWFIGVQTGQAYLTWIESIESIQKSLGPTKVATVWL